MPPNRMVGSGKDYKNWPITNCPGMRASMPSSLHDIGVFKQASTSVNTVLNSLNVSFVSPMVLLRHDFMTTASQIPPKWGLRSGTNFKQYSALNRTLIWPSLSAVSWEIQSAHYFLIWLQCHDHPWPMKVFHVWPSIASELLLIP